jgi:hypothetical protein
VVQVRVFFKPTFLAIALLVCFATPAYALDVTLQWDANTESNLAGYKVYYKTGSSGGGILANYNGTGASEGDSPIDMPLALDENPDLNIVEFTVTDLTDGLTYYFVVTAYNDDIPPLESGPSNEEHTIAPPSDTTPPYATNRTPAPGATDVSVSTLITLEVRDAGVGVDQTTITMRVNGSQVTPSISGTPAAYTISYNPPVNFAYDQTVSVEVDASDLDGNAMGTDAYSFTTGPAPDITPPYTTDRSPAPGATGVAISTLISLVIRDAGVGVDQSTITMRVDGSLVTPSISGSPAAYTLSYNPNPDFAYDQTVVVEVDAADLNANVMATDAYSFGTGPAPDTTPPMISNVQATSITDTSAVITWTTDEASDSEVQYGTTSGNYPSIRNSTNMVTNHTINLTGLSQDTTYYYRVRSMDAADNTRTSSELTFSTDPPPDYTVLGLPLALQGTTPESNDVTLTFNNIPAGTASIELVLTVFDADFSDEGRLFINGQGPITLFGSQGVGTNDGISVTLNPISTDVAWYQLGQNTLTIWHDSTAGFTIEDISIIFSTNPPPDTTPPVISNVQVTSVTDSTAVVTWTTNEASDSLVQYGTTSGSYPLSNNSPSLVSSHSVTLTGLNDNMTYFFRVGSTDGSGNGPTMSNELNFTTDLAPDTTPPAISNVQVTSITETTAIISWTTNEPSDSEVQYDSASRLWGSYPWGENDDSLVTSHSITLTGLEGDTTYYFRVGSTDGSGNGPTTSNEMTFTTEANPVPPSSPTQLKIIRTQ